MTPRPSSRWAIIGIDRRMRRALGLVAICVAVPGIATAQEAPQLELGGMVRARAELYDGRPFGPVGPGEDDYILWRALAHAELKADEDWTAYVQIGLHAQSGRDRGPAPTDRGAPDIRQAYIDVRLGDRVRVKAGRQELFFGSSRLVSARDGPNLRRVFDGARLAYRRARWRADAFLARPVEDRPGAFDDRGDRGQLFGGLYVTRTAGAHGLDLYYLYLARDDVRFGVDSADERRHSFGTRLFGRSGSFDYNLEAVVQTGSFGAKSIGAWTVASDLGVTFAQRPFAPRIGLKANITSGDGSSGDNRLGTFNPLFPNLSYFNEAALLAPQNHMDIHPSLTLSLTPRLQVTGGADWFWKTRRSDDIYRGPGVGIGARGGHRTIGRQADINVRWRPAGAVEVKLAYVRFDVGEALQRRSGADLNYLMASIQSAF